MIGNATNVHCRQNPQHDEAESQNNNNHKTPGRQRKVKHPEAHFLGLKILWNFLVGGLVLRSFLCILGSVPKVNAQNEDIL